MRRGCCPGRTLTSIFFGGGTPSLMEPATVAAVIDAAREHWAPADDIEITLEANPNSVEAARFADLAAAGVNRLSLGLQSFDDGALAFLGRAHSAREGLRALEIAQRHFRRVSFDLIYALPGDTEDSWSATLGQALGLGTDAPLALPADDRAGHALRQHGRAAASSSRSMPTSRPRSVRADRRHDVGRRPAGLRDQQPRAARRRRAATTSPTGATAIMPAIGPGAHGRRLGMRTVRHRKPENFLSALRRNGHGIAEEASLSPTEARRRGAGHGPAAARRDRRRRHRRAASACDSIVDWARVDRLVALGSSDPRTARGSR